MTEEKATAADRVLQRIETAKTSTELRAIINQLEADFESGDVHIPDSYWPVITGSILKAAEEII